jgi:phenylacetate-CoA ligase
MIEYNKFLEKIMLPFSDRINGSDYIRQLNFLRKIYTYNEYDLKNIQEEKLNKLLNHAAKKCPYYSNLISYKTLKGEQWLKEFPVIDKITLREQTDQLLTKDKNKLIKKRSSGSTGGIPSIVYLSAREESLAYAIQTIWWEWSGYKIGDPMILTGITKRTFKKKIKDFIFRTYYLKAFSHTSEDAEKALKWASYKSDPVLIGYASSLYLLANYENKLKIKPGFKTIISLGDKLFTNYKETLEEQFESTVFDTYGSAEGLQIAAQKDLPWMYIMTPNVYLEILDDDGNEVPDGTMGHVVATNLDNYSMPLIRYKIGDLAIKMPKEEYPLQRQLGLPLLKKVIGRDTDIIKTKSGKYMTVHGFNGIFKNISEIKQTQIVQNDLNGIIIKYIPHKCFQNQTFNIIEKKIRKKLEEPDFRIDFEQVERILPSKSGKPQMIVSHL